MLCLNLFGLVVIKYCLFIIQFTCSCYLGLVVLMIQSLYSSIHESLLLELSVLKILSL